MELSVSSHVHAFSVEECDTIAKAYALLQAVPASQRQLVAGIIQEAFVEWKRLPPTTCASVRVIVATLRSLPPVSLKLVVRHTIATEPDNARQRLLSIGERHHCVQQWWPWCTLWETSVRDELSSTEMEVYTQARLTLDQLATIEERLATLWLTGDALAEELSTRALEAMLAIAAAVDLLPDGAGRWFVMDEVFDFVEPQNVLVYTKLPRE